MKGLYATRLSWHIDPFWGMLWFWGIIHHGGIWCIFLPVVGKNICTCQRIVGSHICQSKCARWVVDRNTFRPPANRYRTTCYKEWWSSGRKIRNLRMCAYTHVRTREACPPHLPYFICHSDVSLSNTTPSLNAFWNFKLL